MREKELRVALVCCGGISLAIYMHGITKEVHKLVRASAALHAIGNRGERSTASYFDRVDATDPEYDTEAVYFELLRDIGRSIELRVIVDIIAGASAGGINGAMLARALSHDLPMGALRDLWLDNGDVSVLLASEAKAKAWSKWLIKPVIWGAAATGMEAISDLEVRQKLSLFVRSRWFEPPLDGHGMAGLMYDAATAMGQPKHSRASLLPSGQGLDLFVTLTDFHGHNKLVHIHDPPLIHEREHHHVLHFSCRRRLNGDMESDFEIGNAPGLAFAARATSSFPGAFPPARIVEMDELVASRGAEWPQRGRFIEKNFPDHLRANVDPATASFIDGSVLNDRPFREAIAAIRDRPAYRQVDRRLVYIDPAPASPGAGTHRTIPGFFTTLRGAISDIPRTQPVTNELSRVAAFNDQVRRLKAIVDSARPNISGLVEGIITAPLDQPITAEQIRTWREQVNAQVARDAGFAYEGYVRLKLASVRAYVSDLIVRLRGVPTHSPLSRVVAKIIDVWAERRGIAYAAAHNDALKTETAAQTLPRWIRFLLAFDVRYRERRLHFLIEGQNRLYQLIDQPEFAGLDPLVVDRLKRGFYGKLDALRRRHGNNFFSVAVHDLVEEIFPVAPSTSQMKHLDDYAVRFVDRYGEKIDRLIDALEAEIDLDANTHDIDELLETLDPREWHAGARREVLINYLGFPFWDVLTFSLTGAGELGEFNEILIDRISPQDARALEGFTGAESLKGTGFGHFAAFLSRAYRENDYLLGRLHAVERLIDIVCDSAGPEAVKERINVHALKKRAFLKIIEAEEKHLPQSAEVIAGLRRAIEAMA